MDMSRIDERSRRYLETQGRFCAFVRWTPAQRVGYGLALVLFAVCAVTFPYATWIGATHALAFIFTLALGVRLTALFVAAARDPAIRVSDEECAGLTDADLPVYSVLVPLFREPEVVPSLLQALRALDYPTDKLDIQLLLEPEDAVTLAALREQALPAHIRITLSPGGSPQTKPRACNAALEQARGRFLVVFDAEDRPEPDQLRKVVAAYARAPADVVCLQCRLSHYNSMQGLFAQWSAMEYLVWYRMLLPGLEWMGAPVPLGGTSNHFRLEALRELGGWDPFNVTEDCDLGMRIARRKWRTQMLVSTTWEESVMGLRAWINQRSRWVKGYWQTWLVHSRGRSVSDFGFWRWWMFFLVVGFGTVILLLNPLMWLVVLAWLFIGWPLMDVTSILSMGAMVLSLVLLAANGVFLLVNMLACVVWRRAELVPAALLSPVEWVLMSVAAWKGFCQFFTHPFHWEKTLHGVSLGDADLKKQKHWLIKTTAPVFSFLFLMLATVGLVVFIGLRIERQMKDQGKFHAVQLPSLFSADDAARSVGLFGFDGSLDSWAGSGTGREIRIATNRVARGTHALEVDARFPGAVDLVCRRGADWSRFQGLALDAFVPASAPEDIQVLFHVRDGDRLWYQYHAPQRLLPGKWTRVEVDLRETNGLWRARDHVKPWDGYSPRQVREFGIRIFGHTNYVGSVWMDDIRGVPFPAREQADRLRATVTDVQVNAETVRRLDKFEVSFGLSRTYSNPFDPAVVDVQGIFAAPDGSVQRVPAFFDQDYIRESNDEKEVLTPVGAARWKIRFAPARCGDYKYVIAVNDRDGNNLRTAPRSLRVRDSERRGPIRVHPRDPAYLAHDTGEFYYPIGHNVCWPVDQQEPYPYEFPKPRDRGTYSFDRYFDKMSRNGENWVRIWMLPGWLGLEAPRDWDGYHGIGRYSLESAWKLDYLLEQAERRGIFVQLTIQHYSEYKNWTWSSSAYSQAMGGPCDEPSDLFRNAEARQFFKNRLRYIVARWGYSPNLLAWELWGEVNLLPGYEPASAARWHAEMGEYLKSIDPWQHLVFTHCHNWQNGYSLWALRAIESVQGNGYIRPPNQTTDHVVNFRRYLSEVEQFRKPVFVAEYGGRSELGAPSADYLEAQLHSGLWASFVHPFGGAAMNWWWNFIDGKDLYFHFKGLAEFARGIDRTRHAFRVVTPEVLPSDQALRAAGMQSDDLTLIWVYHAEIFTVYEKLPEITGGTLVLPWGGQGGARIEFWDTCTGRIVHRVDAPAGDTIEMKLPVVRRDLAVKVFRTSEPAP